MYTLQKYKNYYNLCLCSLSWQSVLAVFPGIPSWQICNLPVLRPVTEFRLGNKK